jgi:hypothetical protein
VSSGVSGYAAGGAFGDKSTIQKFPFASDSNSTDVGELDTAMSHASGSASLTSGYVAGGSATNKLQKWPFASDSPAACVGSMAIGTCRGAGAQV